MMKFVFYTICVSPHQIPLAKEIASILGENNYRFIGQIPLPEGRSGMGWGNADANLPWVVNEWECAEEARKLLEDSDVLMSGVRDVALFERRAARGLMTIYTSERWFKPWQGMLRLLRLSYFKMAWHFVKLLRKNNKFYYFPMGIHAAHDMARLCGLMNGDLRCLFSAPKLDFDRKPGGKIWLKSGGDGWRYCLDKMRMWGYFVAPSQYQAPHATYNSQPPTLNSIRVLWVGRLLKLKRVDTIIRAVGELSRSSSPADSNSNSNLKFTLDIYGTGPEESHLKRLAAKYGNGIKFYPSVSIVEVRKLMRSHDVYVLSSNAYEGWGAVISEALEEEMLVLGSREAGSSATILPESNLFYASDWRKLMDLLSHPIANVFIGQWSAKNAARQVVELCENYDNINCKCG